MKQLVLLIAIGGLMIEPSFAQTTGPDCISELAIPDYDFVARRAPNGGEVKASITLGSKGVVGKIDFGDSDPNLSEAVRHTVTDLSTFKSECAGQNLELRFTFRLEGEPRQDPPVWSYFRPPNHFIIVSRPVTMIIDRLPNQE